MWATCPPSASFGYHAEFHEVCYQKHTNLLNCGTSSSDISGYHADFHEGHGHCRRMAGARHGMCELDLREMSTSGVIWGQKGGRCVGLAVFLILYISIWRFNIIYTFVRARIRRQEVGKPEGKRQLGRPRRRWENNIKTDLKEVGCGVWTGLSWLRIDAGDSYLWMR
jgi:hypothetical protein